MILKKLFEQQEKLDKRIIKEHNLQGKDLFDNKIVALIVELGECANEIRFFKHWSNKKPSKKDVILEEFVDIFHFALSIGNDLKSDRIVEHDYVYKYAYGDLCNDFIEISRVVLSVEWNKNNIKRNLKEEYFINMLELILGFAYKLGFTWKDIETAYYKKNEINFQRQNEGY